MCRSKDWTKLGTDVGLQAEFDKAYERARDKMLKKRIMSCQATELVPLEQQYNLICEAVNEAKEVLPDKPKAGKKGRERSETTKRLHIARARVLQPLKRGSPEFRREQ